MSVVSTPKEVLEAARQLLIDDDWTPYAGQNYHEYDWGHPPRHKLEPRKPWFITQAVSCAAQSETSRLKWDAIGALGRIIGIYLPRWELAKGRTQDEVIGLFDQAIASLC